MWDTIASSFALFAQVDNAVALLVGVVIGTIIGAIPGMTTPMGVALALPFTFTMQPVTGILLLLGVYKGGLYGGSITAILINAPGTPAASCTGLDGYPLAQRGEARPISGGILPPRLETRQASPHVESIGSRNDLNRRSRMKTGRKDRSRRGERAAAGCRCL